MAVISLPTTCLPSASANLRQGTAGEGISNGEVVYKSSDGLFYKAEADSTAPVADVWGIAVNTAVTGSPLTVVTAGIVTGASSVKQGQWYLLSNVAGDLAEVAADLTEDGSYVTFIGIGLTTTSLTIQPFASGVKLNLT